MDSRAKLTSRIVVLDHLKVFFRLFSMILLYFSIFGLLIGINANLFKIFKKSIESPKT